MIAKQKSRQKLISVRVYFTDNFLLDKISNISEGLGVSMSDAAGMAIRAGIENVEKSTRTMIGKKNVQIKKAK